ncbi:DNA primase [Streptomyces cyanogenus]|uniref:Histone H1-like nucleoprotein HC2 n=1 Tax=Streptomyces cyanogenus TaxID=80860 RepID=A0ABX7U332_STRCY|nr:DNA primase [Streptomyces cyanogenus]QTE02077.1 Histone H1-like nucleoprotein HC2 [Streptomyces cyanogenus]
MNRTALGLAVGAGYLLGRTKKLKMALAVGSLVAGKKLNLSPRMVADLVNQQLKNNPQFKEIGDQLRQDLRGVGKAASGAVAERQINALADRLHGRTAQVRDQLSGVAPSSSGEEPDEEDGEEGREQGGRQESADDRDEDQSGQASRDGESRDGEPARKAPAKKTAGKKSAARKTAPAKKTAAKKASAARRTAAKKTASAGDAASGAASRRSKGGDDR